MTSEPTYHRDHYKFFSPATQRDLALGTITGLRAWRIAKNGVLTGVVYSYQGWVNGINRASCGSRVGVANSQPYYTWTNAYLTRAQTELGAAAVPGRCASSGFGCGCGFWAYHDGGKSAYPGGDVLGVIEGWGKTDVGTKGFRCEYAKIKALYIKPAWQMPKSRNFMQAFYNLLWYVVIPVMYVILIGISSGYSLLINIGWLAGWALSTIMFSRSSTLSPRQIRQIKRNYPDAKIYRNYDKMLKEHPVSYKAGEVT